MRIWLNWRCPCGTTVLATVVETTVRARALQAAVEGLRIVTSALGDKAGVVGAGALARH
jgi:hypothetical protein